MEIYSFRQIKVDESFFERKSTRLRNVLTTENCRTLDVGKINCNVCTYSKQYVLWFWTKYALIPKGSWCRRLWNGRLILSKATRCRSNRKILKITRPWNNSIQNLIKETACVLTAKPWRHNRTGDQRLNLHEITNYSGLKHNCLFFEDNVNYTYPGPPEKQIKFSKYAASQKWNVLSFFLYKRRVVW